MPEKVFARSVVHLIDDDEAMLESLSFLLRSADLEVRSYLSARAFLDALPDSTLGCVITDVRMPVSPEAGSLRVDTARGSTFEPVWCKSRNASERFTASDQARVSA